MTTVATDAWAGDSQFEDSIIAEVHAESGGGWSITKADGWSFGIPADSPVIPTVGMTVRMYGAGIGSIVRGLFLDGVCVYYRSEEQQKQHSEALSYGKDAKDLLRKWDSDDSVWSIAMGGFGPGYEQAIQVAAFEVLRHLVEERDIQTAEADALPSLNYLGLSGAQWGAAKALANAFHQRGPIRVHKEFDADRHILVSKNFPSPQMAEVLSALKAVAAAIPDMPDGLWMQVDAAIAKAEGRS